MARAPAEVLEDPNAAPTTGYAAPLMPGGFGGSFHVAANATVC